MELFRCKSIYRILLLPFVFVVAGGQIPYVPPLPKDLIIDKYNDESGEEIQVITIKGKPPDFLLNSSVAMTASSMNLSGMPAYDWSFGCSATSAAMMAAYYDIHGYPDIYTGPTNGGVMPQNNSTWGYVIISNETRKQCPLSATGNGLDGRIIRGHVDDYWIKYGNASADPFITNGWAEHTSGDCLGDYMKTNQSTYNNIDGGTLFYYYSSGAPYHGTNANDGGYGMQLFFESRGYSVVDRYTQLILGYNGNTAGFTFSQYIDEIDAGRPVLIQVVNHTMIGFGYDDTDSTIYIHDTWDYSDHSMKWGTYYYNTGMTHWGIVVLQLEPAPSNITIQQISLAAGWNLVSSYQLPQNSSISAIVSPLGGNLVIMKNGSGRAYWPAYNIDQIITWEVSQAYLIYVSTSATLEIYGTAQDPVETPIDLHAGWNMIAYLCTSSQSTAQALNSIQSALVIAKNGQGQVYWPAYGINTIGDMQPGQGYNVYVTTATTLTYPANSLARESAWAGTILADCVHFTTGKRQNGANAIMIWRGLPFPNGDEIAAIAAGGQLVGSGVVRDGQALLTVWGDDSVTSMKDGAAAGETLSLRRWSQRDDQENALLPERIYDALSNCALSGQCIYGQDRALLLEGVQGREDQAVTEFQLLPNYPNPFNMETIIEYALPQQEMVVVEIFNMAGERVRLLRQGIEPAGQHRAIWDGRSDNGTMSPSGLFLVRCISGAQVRTIKAMLMR